MPGAAFRWKISMKRLSAILGIAIAGAASALAGIVNVAPGSYTGDPTGGSLAAHARFRVDTGNWDMLLDRDRQPENGSIGTRNLGSNFNNQWLSFSITNVPGTGLSFRMWSASFDQTIPWSGALPSSFDTILLESRATLDSNQTGTRSLSVQNLSFAGQTSTGTWGNLSVSQTGPGTQLASTFAWADYNLATASWTLSGQLMANNAAIGGNLNPSERLRLYFDFRDTDVALLTAVPVPGAALLGALGLGIAGWMKRRMA